MTNLDGLCQGGPEGEKYPKTTRTGKATKKQTKRIWKSLVRASSSAQPTEEKKEEEYSLNSNALKYRSTMCSLQRSPIVLLPSATICLRPALVILNAICHIFNSFLCM